MHRLTFPFDQEMYDAGLVVRMRRSLLVEHVLCAAVDTHVPEVMRHELVEAVDANDVATVAVGAFKRSVVPDCYCPAVLAGLVVTPDPAVTVHESLGLQTDPIISRFAFAFDCSVYRVHGRTMVIEVIND